MMKKDKKQKLQPTKRLLMLSGLVAATVALTGCPALFVGGVAMGVVSAVDRRSTGAQVDDQTIELRAKQDILKVVQAESHINVTSYNRQVLLTGEVSNAEDKAAAGAAASKIANVRGVVNALAIGPNTSFSTRSGDTYLSGRVKTALTEVDNLSAGHIKVISERSVVYLMGIVTAREAEIASNTASIVAGVRQVVRVFEIISEEELKKMLEQVTSPEVDAHVNAETHG